MATDRPTRPEPTGPGEPAEQVSDRVLTIPNALSTLRLLGVPLFLWLVLGPEEDAWAVVVLAVSGFTDWLDGQIARRMGQISRVGQLLDPIADRAYVFATVLGLALRDIIPWWLMVALVGRDIVLTLLTGPPLHRRGYNGLPVHFLGKAATAALLYSFPLLFLGDSDNAAAMVCRILGWAFAIWGLALYYYSALLYLRQARHLVVTVRPPHRSGSA